MSTKRSPTKNRRTDRAPADPQEAYARVVYDTLKGLGAATVSASAIRIDPSRVDVFVTFTVRLRERRRGVSFCNGCPAAEAADWARRIYEQELAEAP